MRFIFAALCLVCLLTAYLTSSPLVLGMVLLGAFLFAFMSVFAFAQARIESNQQRQSYAPSAEEKEVMRLAAEKRRRAASMPRRGAAGMAADDFDADAADSDGSSD